MHYTATWMIIPHGNHVKQSMAQDEEINSQSIYREALLAAIQIPSAFLDPLPATAVPFFQLQVPTKFIDSSLVGSFGEFVRPLLIFLPFRELEKRLRKFLELIPERMGFADENKSLRKLVHNVVDTIFDDGCTSGGIQIVFFISAEVPEFSRKQSSNRSRPFFSELSSIQCQNRFCVHSVRRRLLKPEPSVQGNPIFCEEAEQHHFCADSRHKILWSRAEMLGAMLNNYMFHHLPSQSGVLHTNRYILLPCLK